MEYKTDTSYSSCTLNSYTTTSCTMSVPFGVGNVFGLIGVTNDNEKHRDVECLVISAKYKLRLTTIILFVLFAIILLLTLVIFLGVSYLRCVVCNSQPTPPRHGSQLQPNSPPIATEEFPSLITTPPPSDSESSSATSHNSTVCTAHHQ